MTLKSKTTKQHNKAVEKLRIVVSDKDGSVHTVAESIYNAIEIDVLNGKGICYLTHPDRTVRLVAEQKIKTFKGR